MSRVFSVSVTSLALGWLHHARRRIEMQQLTLLEVETPEPASELPVEVRKQVIELMATAIAEVWAMRKEVADEFQESSKDQG